MEGGREGGRERREVRRDQGREGGRRGRIELGQLKEGIRGRNGDNSHSQGLELFRLSLSLLSQHFWDYM